MSMGLSKKEAIRKFKEQKPAIGIYAIRCAVTGHAWVGSSRNLGATRNRSWFTLGNGSFMDSSLQEEWNAHGESAFQYEILETLDPELLPMAAADLLKERSSHWTAQLPGKQLLPG
ncbi:MAG TPA: GIY-YIG nuclease family protein [Bryobacteraceae bacterium]|nr:GIY-YIG nuclease family protein [Bryobacteraceae bacterium]